MKINGLILAAGLSSRMGDFKPLMPVRDRTLIESSIQSVLNGGAAQVLVVLGHRADEVEAVIRARYTAQQVPLCRNSDYAATDMLASCKIGLAALPPCGAFFFLPGDMPAIAQETFFALCAARAKTGARVIFPTLAGRRKHPPLVGVECIPAILAYDGPGGLRGVWQQLEGEIAHVPVDDTGCLLDTDTMQDYQKLLRFMGQKPPADDSPPGPDKIKAPGTAEK